MHYKTKSLLTIGIIVAFMAVTAIFINNLEGAITGAVVKPVCECDEDLDCNDNIECTEDSCLYPENCEASLCINKNIC